MNNEKGIRNMKYRVLSRNRPAKYPECEVDPSWDNCDFLTYKEANSYAKLWLGDYRTAVPAQMKIGVEYDYTGLGDKIKISNVEETMSFIEKEHLEWFKQLLIQNGAPESISDKQVMSSCGFDNSLAAFQKGWERAEVIIQS